MKFEILQELPKYDTETRKANGFGKISTNRVSQHRVVTNLQFVKKKKSKNHSGLWSAIKCMYHILFFHQLIVIFIVSSFWLAWMMLLWRFAYRFLCGHMLWFPLGIYLGVELLDHLVTVLEELPDCFPKWLHHFTFTSSVWGFSSLHILAETLVIISFLLLL